MDLVNETNFLFETPSYSSGDYGLPVKIFFAPAEKAKHHYPRIKVLNTKNQQKGKKPNLEPVILKSKRICFRDDSMTCKSIGLEPNEFYALSNWMIINKDIICSYHNYLNVTPNLDRRLEIALSLRYEFVQKYGDSNLQIPHKCTPKEITFVGVTYDTDNVENIFMKKEVTDILKQEQEQEQQELEQVIKEYQILSGMAVD